MDALTALVAELRGEPAPEQRLDPRGTDLAATGNAHVAYELDRRPQAPAAPGRRAATGSGGSRDDGRGDGQRLVGHGVRHGAGRRRAATS